MLSPPYSPYRVDRLASSLAQFGSGRTPLDRGVGESGDPLSLPRLFFPALDAQRGITYEVKDEKETVAEVGWGEGQRG